MKKKKVLLAASIVTGVLCVALAAVTVFQSFRCLSYEKQVSSLEAQNKSLSDEVKKLNTKLEEAVKTAKKQSTIGQDITQTEQTQPGKAEQLPTNVAGKRVAYLTFDDGPSYTNTPKLLDILKQNNVKATFFVIAEGKDTPERRALMKREVAEGHTIAIHSYTHNYNYIYANEGNFLSDFEKMRDMIVSATGVQPKFMRFPGGTDNTVSIRAHNGTPIVPALLNEVQKRGVTPVDWTAGGMDAVVPVPSKEKLVNGVVNECRNRKSAIILLHDSDPHASSIAAVPEIIKQLRAMGYEFAPLTSSAETMHRNPAAARNKK